MDSTRSNSKELNHNALLSADTNDYDEEAKTNSQALGDNYRTGIPIQMEAEDPPIICYGTVLHLLVYGRQS